MKKTMPFLALAIALGLGYVLFSPSSDPASPNAAVVLAETESFTYEEFSDDRFNELRGSEEFSVFVHSKTCGTCAKKHSQIMSEKDQFTDGVILKMDYAQMEADFGREFNVTKWDTFINFNADGSFETVGGDSVENVREALQS